MQVLFIVADACSNGWHLVQIRQLLSVALGTNRTLIMPKLLCYCDRYWGPLHRCRLPGARKLQLPFICPLDHIFEPFHFDDNPTSFGPPFAYREHSFLENERTPPEVKNGVTLMHLQVSRSAGTPSRMRVLDAGLCQRQCLRFTNAKFTMRIGFS